MIPFEGERHEKFLMVIGAGILLVIVLLGGWWLFGRPERGTTGSVSTQFWWLGPNDKISWKAP